MAIVLTCHLIETIWDRKHTGMRAPFMVIDHNGQQQQTETMQAGAVTVWNTRATFPYAPSSDLVVMAFDAAGRQPGSFIAQAVVDIAAMLQQGSLNASAPLVNRKGQNVGVVLFDVGLVTSSRALAAGLDIPSLTLSTEHCSDSPTARLTRSNSPSLAAAKGRNSPFAQLAVQCGVANGSEPQPTTPSSAQSISQKLVGTISQALVGVLLGLETRDRDETEQQGGSLGLRSSSWSPRRMGTASRSLDCSPTRQTAQLRSSADNPYRAVTPNGAAAAAAAAGSPSSAALLSRRRMHQVRSDSLEQPPSPSCPMARSSTSYSTVASVPAMANAAAERANFSAWRQSLGRNGPLMAGRPVAVSAAGALAAGAAAGGIQQQQQQQQQRMAVSANGRLTRVSSSSSNSSPQAVCRRSHARRPSQLAIPGGQASGDGVSQGASTGSLPNNATLSPLTEARTRLQLQRPQPLPPLSHLFPPTQRDGLIPVGRAPMSPGGYSQATTAGFTSQYSHPLSQGPEASADYDALLREFDDADAAGKEAILFRELMLQQEAQQTGSSQLLNILAQQHQQEVLQHRQLMNALEGIVSSGSPVTSAARAAADAFRSCFTSSTQITSGSSSNGANSSNGSASSGGTPFKHYPNLPEFSAAATSAAAAAPAASPRQQQRPSTQSKGVGSPTASSAVSSPSRPAAGGLLQQLSSAESAGSPLLSARQGLKLLGDRVGQRGSAQSSPTSAADPAAAATVAEDAAIVRQLNWQLLERMTQQEMAATAAAASVLKSYAISHVGTELSTGALEVDPPQDASEPASAPEPRRPVAVPPAYTCKKAPGQLGAYTTNSSNSKQAVAKNSSGGSTAAGSSSRRWMLPAAKDVVPYPKPQPAFPATAVTVEPTAPLIPVPEEYPCA